MDSESRRRLILLIAFLPVLFGWIYALAVYFQGRLAIESYLKSHKWALPSTIYADSVDLERGMAIGRASLLRYFQRLNYQRATGDVVRIKAGEYTAYPNRIIFRKRPLFSEQPVGNPIRIDIESDRIRRIVDLTTDQPLERYELEPVAIKNLFGSRTEKRRIVSYDDLPPQLIQAVIAIEDRRFFQHHGIDFTAILRAITKNLGDSKNLQGGSTITQQFVKNSFLTPEKSMHRKIIEAAMAMMLERRLTKKQILELYLNEIYLGQSGSIGIHGVGEASYFFFAKDVTHLTTPESALLAGIIQAPTTFNPYRHPEDAIRRRNVVLAAMAEQGFITFGEFNEFRKTPLRVHSLKSIQSSAPYFTDLVSSVLAKQYDGEVLSENLSIFTTLDLEMQEAAEEALATGLGKIDKERAAETGRRVQGCLIAIEPDTGLIRAFVGGRDSESGLFNHINQALRQTGSVFKPVVYAAAMENTYETLQAPQKASASSRNYFTPATMIADEPFAVENANETWQPKNSDGQYHGNVSLRTALAQSLNVATARLAKEIGWRNITALAQKMGFPNLKPYPSVALGVFEATPWQVATAYTAFANGGVKTELRPILKVADDRGKILEESRVNNTRVIQPETAYLITDLMRSVMIQGTASQVQRSGFTRPAAGKTGTTDEFRDAWFAGYIPQLLCVVWIGYDDNAPLEMHGAEAALPIWIDFMKKAAAKLPVKEFKVPSGIIAERIDPTTGLKATPSCPTVTDEIFIRGTEPQVFCEEHQRQFFTYFRPDSIRRDYWERPRPTRGRGRSTGIWRKLKRIFRF